MWIKQLRLENFQSHEDGVLNFHPNFNCIIGTGNSGKSAIVRALSFILFGQWEPSWVRNGAASCRIILTMSDDTVVVREKGAKLNRYVVNRSGEKEQVYENFGTGVPEPIEQLLHIFKAKIGDKEELNLNLSNQLDQLFLLSNPGSYKAKVLGKLSKAHYLDHALKEINRDKKRLSLERTVAEKEIPTLENEIKQYDGLDAEQAKLDSLGTRIEGIKALEERLRKLKQLHTTAMMWKDMFIRERAEQERLDKVRVASTEKLVALYDRLKQLRQLSNKVTQHKALYETTTQIIQQLDSSRTLLFEKYVSALKDNKKCPTCFTDVTEDTCKKILETL